MSRFAEFSIRIFAFVRKELFETLRQPRLIALLVLGPFLLVLFNPAPRTLQPGANRTPCAVIHSTALGRSSTHSPT